jgi:metal-responsive CopG/Arc/MetJ family transcriptional regulator
MLEYNWSMKLKTSVTLSEHIVKRVDLATKKGESRSQAIERLLAASLVAEARRTSDLRDLAIINEHAEDLNAEAEDVLRYQVKL